MALAALLVRIGADLTGLNKGLSQADRDIQKFGKKLVRIGGDLTQNLTVPIGAAMTALGAMTINVGRFADELGDLSDATGLSTTSLQEYRHIATVAGVDVNTLANAAIKLTTAMSAGDEQTKQLKVGLEKIGLSATDASGRLVSMDVLLPKIVTKLQGLSDVTTRNTIAADIFGKSWASLAPILSMSADETDRLRKEAHKLGLVLSKEQVAAADEFAKKMNVMGSVMSAVSKQVGLMFLPVMVKVVDLIQSHLVPALQSVIKWWADLMPATKLTIGGFVAVAAAIGPVIWLVGKIGTLWPLLGVMFAAIASPIGMAVIAVGTLTVAGLQLIKHWDSVKLQFLLAWTQMKDAVFTGTSWILKALSALFFKVPALSMKFLEMGLAVDQMAKDSLLGAMPVIDALEAKIIKSADAVTTATTAVTKLGNALRGLPKNVTLPGLTQGMRAGVGSSSSPVPLGPFKFTDEMGDGLRRNIPTPGTPNAPQQGPKIGDAIMGQMPQIVQSFAAFGPMAAILPVISGAMEVLGPILEQLITPLVEIGRAIGTMLVPLFKALATVTSYVMEAMGWLVRGIGKLIDSIPGISAKGVINAGQAMMDAARAARSNAKASDKATQGLNDLANALTNVPKVFNVAALRHSLGGSPSTTGTTFPGTGNTTIYITVPGAGDPIAVAENVGRAIESARRRGSTSRIVLATA